MSLEVGPSLRTIDTAVFNASELIIMAEMILFVFASRQVSYPLIRVLSFLRSDNSTEVAVREAALVANGTCIPPKFSPRS